MDREALWSAHRQVASVGEEAERGVCCVVQGGLKDWEEKGRGVRTMGGTVGKRPPVLGEHCNMEGEREASLGENTPEDKGTTGKKGGSAGVQRGRKIAFC